MKKFITGAVLSLVATTALAETQLEPLEDILNRPKDQIEVGYPFIRCASLFNGMIGYGGANFGDEMLASLKSNYTNTSVVAVLVRINHAKEKGLPTIEVNKRSDRANLEISRLTDVYINRLERNFASSGQAWGSDPLISGDLEICKAVAQIASTAMQQ